MAASARGSLRSQYIDVFAVVGKAVSACFARCFAPGLRVAAFQGFAVKEDGVAVGGVEAVKQAECQGIGGLDFAAAIVGLCAVGGVAFAEMAEGGGIAAVERAQGGFVFAIYGIGVAPVALAEMGEAVALHGGKQFGAVVDMVAVAGNQAAWFGEYFEGGGVAAAQFAVGAGAAELDGVALDAPAVFGFVESEEGKPGHGCLLESV